MAASAPQTAPPEKLVRKHDLTVARLPFFFPLSLSHSTPHHLNLSFLITATSAASSPLSSRVLPFRSSLIHPDVDPKPHIRPHRLHLRPSEAAHGKFPSISDSALTSFTPVIAYTLKYSWKMSHIPRKKGLTYVSLVTYRPLLFIAFCLFSFSTSTPTVHAWAAAHDNSSGRVFCSHQEL